MKRHTAASGALLSLLAACAPVACGANSAGPTIGGYTAGASGADAAAGAAGSAATSSGGSGGWLDSSVIEVSVPDGSEDDAETCLAQTETGKLFPLDMYVMLDQSGSMDETIGLFGSVTRFAAATNGLTQFFDNPSSDGIGVGIQFFPLHVTPLDQLKQCPSVSDCDSATVCLITVTSNYCVPSCQGASDCPKSDCVMDGSQGACYPDSCDAADYSKPEVDIAPLPGVKDQILNAMASHGPSTATPTVPALTGALSFAREHAKTHPTRKTIVVLATDGMPTVCPESDSAALVSMTEKAAADGMAATPAVQTFVIGLVDQLFDFAAVPNLNRWATAGGTGQALIVPPDQDMGAKFASALDNIRGTALGCEYEIPQNDGGKVDYGKVNVQYTPGGSATETFLYVGDVSQCDPDAGGWYYDTDPSQQDPSRITLCPASCTKVQTPGQNATLNIAMGCKTWVPK
jgi:hypothetical protein